MRKQLLRFEAFKIKESHEADQAPAIERTYAVSRHTGGTGEGDEAWRTMDDEALEAFHDEHVEAIEDDQTYQAASAREAIVKYLTEYDAFGDQSEAEALYAKRKLRESPDFAQIMWDITGQGHVMTITAKAGSEGPHQLAMPE